MSNRAHMIAAILAAGLLAPLSAAAQEVQVERPVTVIGAIDASTEDVTDADDAALPELPVLQDEATPADAADDASSADARPDLGKVVEAQ